MQSVIFERIGGIILRVVTWNLNGIRAAHRKGMDDFVNDIDADVWLFQEVRALPEQMPSGWSAAPGHEVIWHPAEKKGYSGVSTWSRVEMTEQGRGMENWTVSISICQMVGLVLRDNNIKTNG